MIKNVASETYYDGVRGGGVWLKTVESVYGGKVNPVTGDCEFYVHDTDDDFYKVIYDVSAGTYSEVIDATLTAPASWDINTQQYWVQKNQELIMDQDHFKYRTAVYRTTAVASASDQRCSGGCRVCARRLWHGAGLGCDERHQHHPG